MYTMASAYMRLQNGRKKKELLRSENLGDYDDQYLIKRYRLNRQLIGNVCDLVRAG